MTHSITVYRIDRTSKRISYFGKHDPFNLTVTLLCLERQTHIKPKCSVILTSFCGRSNAQGDNCSSKKQWSSSDNIVDPNFRDLDLRAAHGFRTYFISRRKNVLELRSCNRKGAFMNKVLYLEIESHERKHTWIWISVRHRSLSLVTLNEFWLSKKRSTTHVMSL